MMVECPDAGASSDHVEDRRGFFVGAGVATLGLLTMGAMIPLTAARADTCGLEGLVPRLSGEGGRKLGAGIVLTVAGGAVLYSGGWGGWLTGLALMVVSSRYYSHPTAKQCLSEIMDDLDKKVQSL